MPSDTGVTISVMAETDAGKRRHMEAIADAYWDLHKEMEPMRCALFAT